MKKEIYRKDIQKFLGLEYLTVTGVPVFDSMGTTFMDVDPLLLERMAAIVIIQREVPIRGKELKIIRSALDLSLAKFAWNFKKDAGTIMKWEKKPLERISLADELLIRMFVADQLGLKLPNYEWKRIQQLAAKEIVQLQVPYFAA